jgi:hypothetical protein
MEPIRPDVREELKRVHPGLADRDIDRYDELTSQRFLVDPDREPERIRQIDLERTRIVQEKMPRLAEIENAVVLRRREASRAPKPPPQVRLKGEPEPPREPDGSA